MLAIYRDLRAHKVFKAFKDLKAFKESKAFKEFKAFRAFRASRVIRVHKESQDPHSPFLATIPPQSPSAQLDQEAQLGL